MLLGLITTLALFASEVSSKSLANGFSDEFSSHNEAQQTNSKLQFSFLARL